LFYNPLFMMLLYAATLRPRHLKVGLPEPLLNTCYYLLSIPTSPSLVFAASMNNRPRDFTRERQLAGRTRFKNAITTSLRSIIYKAVSADISFHVQYSRCLANQATFAAFLFSHSVSKTYTA